MEELVKQSIEEIKPFLKRDGGDIEFVELTPENVVKVRLKGACHGCPGAQLTLQTIVERIVKEAVPEVTGIEAVRRKIQGRLFQAAPVVVRRDMV